MHPLFPLHSYVYVTPSNILKTKNILVEADAEKPVDMYPLNATTTVLWRTVHASAEWAPVAVRGLKGIDMDAKNPGPERFRFCQFGAGSEASWAVAKMVLQKGAGVMGLELRGAISAAERFAVMPEGTSRRLLAAAGVRDDTELIIYGAPDDKGQALNESTKELHTVPKCTLLVGALDVDGDEKVTKALMATVEHAKPRLVVLGFLPGRSGAAPKLKQNHRKIHEVEKGLKEAGYGVYISERQTTKAGTRVDAKYFWLIAKSSCEDDFGTQIHSCMNELQTVKQDLAPLHAFVYPLELNAGKPRVQLSLNHYTTYHPEGFERTHYGIYREHDLEYPPDIEGGLTELGMPEYLSKRILNMDRASQEVVYLLEKLLLKQEQLHNYDYAGCVFELGNIYDAVKLAKQKPADTVPGPLRRDSRIWIKGQARFVSEMEKACLQIGLKSFAADNVDIANRHLNCYGMSLALVSALLVTWMGQVDTGVVMDAD